MALPTSHFSKALIEKSYDKVALRYLDWTSQYPSPREQYLRKLLALLPERGDSRVLELGCGAGIPCTKLLIEHGCEVVANDISSEQLGLVRQNLGSSDGKLDLIKGDMMELEFRPGSFDAVVAFYSIIHLPRTEQNILLSRMQGWLKHGGHILINLGTTDVAEDFREAWLGEGMYWSGFDTEGNKNMVLGAGFEILEGEVISQREEEDKVVPFLWVLGKKGLEAKEQM
jgi:SAM-dependent methyltransferase